MNKKFFWLLFTLILIFQFVVRIIPPQNHNFFFTVDQADDAVWVREIVDGGRLVLHGTRTNIPGVYSGPLWYYFLAVGYFLFQGDPFGGVFMVILLNTVLVGVLMWVIKKEVGWWQALTVGGLLQSFWWFYDTSRWAFNPFPLVSTATLTILLLVSFLKGNKKVLLLAAVPVFLGFSFEIAGASAIFLFYLLFIVWAFLKKRISLRSVGLAFALSGVFALVLVYQLGRRFLANRAGEVLPGQSTGYFAGTNFTYITDRFLEIISYAVIPYQPILSVGILGLLIYYFLQKKEQNAFVRYFVILSLGLFAVCFIFFGSNKGWYDWHTLYLPVLLFTSFILLILEIPLKYAVLALTVVLGIQFSIFKDRYLQYLKPSDDPGLLVNQLTVLDWIYGASEGDGFNAYTYMPSERDYPYQYTFWWYGRGKYGFVPCEYSVFPGDLKLYVPNPDGYSKPVLGCDKFRFLIIEPHKDSEHFEKRLIKARGKTFLLEEKQIGKIKIEKRRNRRQEEL